MLKSIRSRVAEWQVIGFINGKRAIHISGVYGEEAEIVGERFWARGYFVSAVARREHYR